jgi:hypothetical protein
MTTDLEAVRHMAKNQVNNKERELTDLMTKHAKDLQTFVDENINDMVRERQILIDKNDKQFSDVKFVVCKYFEKYDEQLLENKI